MSNPYDIAFKDFFSNPEYIREISLLTLPKQVSESLNYNSIKPEKGSFIDHNMKEYHSDLIFSLSTKEKNPVKIYLLFEHKSYIDKKIDEQLFFYVIRLYLKCRCIVIPLVFYHGSKKWTLPKNIANYFKLSEKELKIFRNYLPVFQYELLDLSTINIKDFKCL